MKGYDVSIYYNVILLCGGLDERIREILFYGDGDGVGTGNQLAKPIIMAGDIHGMVADLT